MATIAAHLGKFCTIRYSALAGFSSCCTVLPWNEDCYVFPDQHMGRRSMSKAREGGATPIAPSLKYPLWLFLFVAIALAAMGDQPGPESVGPAALKTLSLEELSQIEVTTPSKEPVKAFKTAAAIYIVTGEDIRRSGATCIPEALRLVPGVAVARIDANTWSIGIRGFGSDLTRSVLVLIDGRTVYTPLFDGTYWDVQDTMMEDIDRIEVIRGPGGTIWGPNAVNGVINVITKSAKETQGTLVSAGGGDVEQGFLSARYGGGNGTDFNYRVYGKGFTRGPEYHPDGQNYGEPRRPAFAWTGKRTSATP